MLALGIILLVLCLLFLMVILIRQDSLKKQRSKSTKPKGNEHGKQ